MVKGPQNTLKIFIRQYYQSSFYIINPDEIVFVLLKQNLITIVKYNEKNNHFRHRR